MFKIRCTARLLKRLSSAFSLACPEPTTRLGDWYADLVYVRRQQFFLAASERTFLPVVIEAAPTSTLAARLRVAVAEVLRKLGIARSLIDTEVDAMNEVAHGKTARRQAVGILVDFAKALPYHVDDGTLLDVSLRLARTPLRPLYNTTVRPDRTAIALFASPPMATR